MAEAAQAAVGGPAQLDQSGSRCRLLEWNPGRSLRGAGHPAARARPAGEVIIWGMARCSTAASSPITPRKRYVSLPSRPDPRSQTTIAERSRSVLRRSTGSVRKLCAEIAMHDRLPTLRHTAPARRGAAAYAAANHARSDAATTLHRGASVCESEIPHRGPFCFWAQ